MTRDWLIQAAVVWSRLTPGGKGLAHELEIRMNGGRNGDVSRQTIGNWSIASFCLSLSVFPLGLAASFLDSMGAWKYVPGRAAVIDVFFATCVLPPIAGAICGHVALRKIAANPELAGNHKYLATAGTFICYILVILWVSYVAFLLIIDIFDIRLINFH
ncbi:MAG: DUF4190 domain-containing protein [Rhodobacteraceae bacterium]|nr:DUF4190 domain-containing protein [Paracoccaceae bacterium]